MIATNIPPTYFIDIDGCIFYQTEDFFKGVHTPIRIKEVREKLLELHSKGCKIILTTGRPESHRSVLENELGYQHIFYDQLIMGCGSGVRILVNDIDPKHPKVKKAKAINVKRNEGLDSL